mgnify:CR=1 FL=1
MEKTRIGVIGMGKMGKYHLQKYHEIEECTIVGIVDVDEGCVSGAAEGYSCGTHTDHRDLSPERCRVAEMPIFFRSGSGQEFLEFALPARAVNER